MILGVTGSSISNSVATVEASDLPDSIPYVFLRGASDYFSTDFDINGYSNVTFVIECSFSLEGDGLYRSVLGVSGSSTTLIIALSDAGAIVFQLYDGTNISNSSTAWTNDGLSHVWAFRYSTTTGVTIYKDGVSFLAANSDTDFTSIPVSRTLQIGKRATNTYTHDGTVNIVKVYNSAISDANMVTVTNDINTVSGAAANFNYQKTKSTWTDEVAAYEGTNEGAVVLHRPKFIFDGTTDSYFTTNYTLSGLGICTFLVEAKIYEDKTYQGFIGDDIDGTRLRFYTDASGVIRTQLQDNSLISSLVKAYTSDFETHQYAYTFDGTSNRFYIDGVLIDTETAGVAFTGFSVSSPKLEIGRGLHTSSGVMTGELSRVQIYSDVKDATALLALADDITGNSTNKVIDFGEQMTSTTWTDDVSGYVATNVGDVVLREPYMVTDYEDILKEAVLSSYTVPSDVQQLAQHRLLRSLDTKGIWSSLDTLWVAANDGSREFAALNWIDPTVHELTEVSSPTWTSDVGFKGNGTSSYVNTNYNPTDDGTNYVQNAASAFIHVVTEDNYDGGYNDYFGGDAGTPANRLTIYDSNDKLGFQVNTGDFKESTSPASGFLHANRDSSTTSKLYRNGSQLDASTETSSGVSAADYFIGGRNNNGSLSAPSNMEWALAGFGGDLTTEMSDLDAIVSEYIDNL